MSWIFSNPWMLAAVYSAACAVMYAALVLGSELLPDDTEDH